MGNSFQTKISYLGHDELEDYGILRDFVLPDTCPICNKSVTPEFLLLHNKNNGDQELLCSCPNKNCDSLFFAVYKDKGKFNEPNYFFDHFTPYSKTEKSFPEEVMRLSPEFIKIYNQAYYAEQENLDLICGGAYRKSLEYLIKDFILLLYPEDDSKIKTMPLQQCIQKYIAEPTIKHMAERATWLGNDETHYVRKWENKDLQDLKNLIDLTVYFISMSRKASKYMEEMVR